MPDIFLSYDSNDEYWRVRFDDVFGHAFPYRMASPGDIGTEDGKEFVKHLLDNGYIDNDTVVLVLIGPKSYSKRQIDWEIAAALEKEGRRPAGLLAMRLPSHEDHGKKSVNVNRVPGRIADNLKSGFINLYDWTESERELETRIYTALKDARTRTHLMKNSRALMGRDMFR